MPVTLSETHFAASAEKSAQAGLALKKPARLEELDSLRGLAAVIVFVYHCVFLLATPASWVRFLTLSPLALFVYGGHQAVILFFVLSGFVLYLPYGRSNGGTDYGNFVVKRICRIYLPYLCSVFVVLIAYLVFFNPMRPKGLSELYGWQVLSGRELLKLVCNFVLFIGFFKRDLLNGVTWTLAEEMRISFLFPFIALAVRRWKARTSIMVALGGSTIVSIGIGLVHRRSPLETLHYACLFVLGAVLAANLEYLKELSRRQSTAVRTLTVSISLLICAYAPVLQARYPTLMREELADWLIAGSVSVFLIMSVADTRLSTWLRHRFMVHCGRTSYGIYLLHLPILFIFVNLFWLKLPHLAVYAMAFVSVLIAADIFYRFVELPSIALGRHLTSSSRKPSLQGNELPQVTGASM